MARGLKPEKLTLIADAALKGRSSTSRMTARLSQAFPKTMLQACHAERSEASLRSAEFREQRFLTSFGMTIPAGMRFARVVSGNRPAHREGAFAYVLLIDLIF